MKKLRVFQQGFQKECNHNLGRISQGYPKFISAFLQIASLSKSQTFLTGEKTKKAFTLAEVLITLVIIGIISVLIIPTVVENYRWQQYKSGVKKALSTLNQSLNMYRVQNGVSPTCGYWKNSPYTGVCTPFCLEYDSDNICRKYTCNDENGVDLPSDYNGLRADCVSLYQFIVSNFKTIKVCNENAKENGCIPDYKGTDQIYSENSGVTDILEINKQTGTNAFRKAEIDSGAAFVTADGMIFFPYAKMAQNIAVDVNGFDGPNKWGYDIHSFRTVIQNANAMPVFVPRSGYVEKGGKRIDELLK